MTSSHFVHCRYFALILAVAAFGMLLEGRCWATTNCIASYNVLSWDERRIFLLTEVGGECQNLNLRVLHTGAHGSAKPTGLEMGNCSLDPKLISEFVRDAEPGMTRTGRVILKPKGKGLSDEATGLDVQPPICDVECEKACKRMLRDFSEHPKVLKSVPKIGWQPVLSGMDILDTYSDLTDQLCLTVLSAQWLPYGAAKEGYLMLVVRSPFAWGGDEARGLLFYRGSLKK